MARDVLCLSHLRWDFVYQRPNHLMSRAARDRRVFFVEEPVSAGDDGPGLRTVVREGVTVVTPTIPDGLDEAATESALAALVDGLTRGERIDRPVVWYYTPMALPWTRRINAAGVVYDSMDYLAGFRGAPPRLLELEDALLGRADLVFTGGASLHRRMSGRHPDVHCFPSSVDLAHFRRARTAQPEPPDQLGIPRPRLGYAGVVDERVDLELIDGVAAARPDVSIVLLGPIAKIAPEDIPDRPNIVRLGLKPYAQLPAYLAGWDAGWMPFARNEATRYISPTKTPEYLAAGRPVISTSIHDVVEPYSRLGFVTIADGVDETLGALDRIATGVVPDQRAVDAFLATGSWDRTWAAMAELVDHLAAREPAGQGGAAHLRARPAAAPALAGSAATATLE